MSKLNEGRLSVRLSGKRLDKLKAIALERDIKVSQLVEQWIDRLPTPKEQP